jgi:hypothetical protein
MPFDPQWPQNGQNIDADRFRGQFSGIIDLINNASGITGVVIDAVNTVDPGTPAAANLSLVGTVLHFSFDLPRGNDGLEGAQGPPFASPVVDAVNTLNPGENATVEASLLGNDVHFTFGIPRGLDGLTSLPITSFLVDSVTTLDPGEPATASAQFDGTSVRLTFGLPSGGPGADGAPGPPFASAIVDSTNTLNPGEAATVDQSFDGSNVHFTFGIPRGSDGINGIDGSVTGAQLDNAIAGTSSNTNAISTLDAPFMNDPPTLADLELMRAKVNELILNGRR